jgi:predicted nucleic acid-binding Zn ribbon protein
MTYDYYCNTCEKDITRHFIPVSDRNDTVCEECGDLLELKVQTGIHVKFPTEYLSSAHRKDIENRKVEK